jgi:hypothetical protein
MIGLALAALFLPLSHFLIASTSLRRHLVGRFGEERYLSFYSGLTVAALVWLIFAYIRAPSHCCGWCRVGSQPCWLPSLWLAAFW